MRTQETANQHVFLNQGKPFRNNSGAETLIHGHKMANTGSKNTVGAIL